jgi:hypothetical protein
LPVVKKNGLHGRALLSLTASGLYSLNRDPLE